MRTRLAFLLSGLLSVMMGPNTAQTQEYGDLIGGYGQGEQTLKPQGPRVMLGAVDPALRKWYVPQELYKLYGWRQWEYTNYAKELYKRYVDFQLEGDYFYDIYGDFVTKGWLIFDHYQRNPQVQFGSSLYKDQRFSGWFDALVISTDQKGQYHYALTVGQRLRTTLTPMTFTKPAFDGIQWDFLSDKYAATVVYSRVNSPGGSKTDPLALQWTNNTTLIGGRCTVQLGDFVNLGGTFVNAHNSTTQLSSFKGNLLKGYSTLDQQEEPISWVEVTLKDDSPEDGRGGASYFAGGSDVVITYLDGTQEAGRTINFQPVVEGGIERAGYLAADGDQTIRIRYDFDSPVFVSRAHGNKSEIKEVEFQLAIGNDYQVWMTSDRQWNRTGQPVLLLVARAPGNVRDNSNLRLLRFNYGLPTATQVGGLTFELQDFHGFNLYAEYDVSYSYRQYPNRNEEIHTAYSGIRGEEFARGWMVNLSHFRYPWFFFGETFSMDDRYNTTVFVTQETPRPGFIDYEDSRRHFFELVEDNDDQDRFADWPRIDHLAGDDEVFPGWDENNDFVADFNANNTVRRPNDIPDYEEPFLRFNVDRPEFLFGIDLNNNTWVDRFENDELPDYPYKRDHRGFNAYSGVHVTPDVKAMIGYTDEWLLSADRQNRTRYALLTADHDVPRWGRLRLFEMLKLAKDDIPDNLLQWVYLTARSEGENRRTDDAMLAPNTWINSLWVGFDLTRFRDLRFITKLKYDLYHQRGDRDVRIARGLARKDYFFGLINKMEYTWRLGRFTLTPRWKSEYRRQTRDLVSAQRRNELTEILSTLVGFRVLSHTQIQTGVELVRFDDRSDDGKDYTSTVVGFQVSNKTDYQGYRVVAQVGFRYDRTALRDQEAVTSGQSYITIFAGLD